MSPTAPDRLGVWVQPIVVDKAGTHEATVLAAATASVAVFMDSMSAPQWSPWLSGAFTKTVRRAAGSALDSVRADAVQAAEPAAVASSGSSRALALLPRRYEDLPRAVARLQVAGTDLPRAGLAALDRVAPVRVAVRRDLSTGKAAAQGAHALWMWVLSRIEDDPELIAHWHRSAMPVDLTFVDDADLEEVARAPRRALVVRDNGLTEVAPGTVTAYALGGV